MLTAQCHAAIQEHGGVMLTLFLAGLTGSMTHCVGMCGPFVLCQTESNLTATSATKMSEWSRISGGLLIPYHLGRMTTYVFLGALSAATAGVFSDFQFFRWIAASLLCIAAVLFIMNAVPTHSVKFFRFKGLKAPMLLQQTLKALMYSPSGFRGYVLGCALGFLPCGLIYAALTAAASTGNILSGAMSMAAFALGTVPALIVLGYGGNKAAKKWRPQFGMISKVVAGISGIMLVVTAGKLVL